MWQYLRIHRRLVALLSVCLGAGLGLSLALADQVVALEDGAVAAQGRPEDLASHPFIAHIRSGAPTVEPV